VACVEGETYHVMVATGSSVNSYDFRLDWEMPTHGIALGDLNRDGVFTVADLTALFRYFYEGDTADLDWEDVEYLADLNEDGRLDERDSDALTGLILGGDFISAPPQEP
jgi:hypothetical protein